MIEKRQKNKPMSYCSFIRDIDEYIYENSDIFMYFLYVLATFLDMGSFTVLHTPSNALQYTSDLSGKHWESFESNHGHYRHTRTPRTPNFDKNSAKKCNL